MLNLMGWTKIQEFSKAFWIQIQTYISFLEQSFAQTAGRWTSMHRDRVSIIWGKNSSFVSDLCLLLFLCLLMLLDENSSFVSLKLLWWKMNSFLAVEEHHHDNLDHHYQLNHHHHHRHHHHNHHHHHLHDGN